MQAVPSLPTSRREPPGSGVSAVRIAASGAFACAIAAAAWTLLEAGEAPRLHAATLPVAGSTDTDGDGLPDVLEIQLGLSVDLVDTDGDSFTDAEEVARHSDGADASSLPNSGPVSVALAVYQENGGPLHPVSVLYAANGGFGGKVLGMGARVGGFVRHVPVSFFMGGGGTSLTKGGKQTGSQVMILDAVFDTLHVVRFGSLSLFTTVAEAGSVVAADVANVAHKGGVFVEYRVFPAPSPMVSGRSTGGGLIGVYTPIDSIAPPVDWTPGEICAQTVVIAGTLGPVIVQEVIEAECEAGWDAYCDPNCAATVGSTIETLDPGALIGG